MYFQTSISVTNFQPIHFFFDFVAIYEIVCDVISLYFIVNLCKLDPNIFMIRPIFFLNNLFLLLARAGMWYEWGGQKFFEFSGEETWKKNDYL